MLNICPQKSQKTLILIHLQFYGAGGEGAGGMPGGMPGGGPGGFPGAGGPGAGATHDDGPTVEEVD